MKRVRAVAFYLPQFHPIPENDAWWGKGFTEWRNVVRARPQFAGHYQPHLPADFGFYDLRLSSVLEEHAAVAQEYGIHGFCFYHYWFNGNRLLHRPLDAMLSSRKPDFPFMLCWANENWTRTWDGQHKHVLMEQVYSEEDHIRHIHFLCDHFFRDERYIRVDGKPVFAVYRMGLIPDVASMTALWRREAQRRGVSDLYLIAVETLDTGIDPPAIGFDAVMPFQPSWKNMPARVRPSLWQKIASRLKSDVHPFWQHKVYRYDGIVEKALAMQFSGVRKEYACVTPMWDNHARRKEKATIIIESTPEKYGRWLRGVVDRFQPYSSEENFVFINAWNEWAEGNHLEPCQKWGRRYLEATRSAMHAMSQRQ